MWPNTRKERWQQEVLGRTNRLLSLIRHGPHWNDASYNSSIVTCVFVTAVTFLPSRCLATIRGFLPSRCLATIRRDTHTHTHTQQRDLISLLYFFEIRKVPRLKMIERSLHYKPMDERDIWLKKMKRKGQKLTDTGYLPKRGGRRRIIVWFVLQHDEDNKNNSGN
jgi:hypothetical protein